MAIDSGLLATELLLVAFAGGAIGAAIGGYPAYGLAGLAITIGEVASVPGASGGAGLVQSTPINSVGVTGLVGYGPVLGPHVAFAGGVAAAAYGGRKGLLDTDFEYHEAKHVTTALGTRPDVLAVGGVFGVVGYWLAQLSIQFSLPWDPVAASVVASALLHRVVFGYPLFGSIGRDVLDMSPYEEGRRRTAPDSDGTGAGSGTATGTGAGTDGTTDAAAGTAGSTADRFVVEPWLPHQYRWSNVTVLGLVVGLFGGFLAIATGSYFLAFGLAATTLLLFSLGIDRFPVTHHMAFPASIAALALPGDVSVTAAILVGGAFGVVGAVVGEAVQRVFYAHADTHLDPPSASILVTTFLLALLDAAGVLETTIIPTLNAL